MGKPKKTTSGKKKVKNLRARDVEIPRGGADKITGGRKAGEKPLC